MIRQRRDDKLPHHGRVSLRVLPMASTCTPMERDRQGGQGHSPAPPLPETPLHRRGAARDSKGMTGRR